MQIGHNIIIICQPFQFDWLLIGPTKYPPSICLFVWSFSSQPPAQISWILHEIRVSSNLKNDGFFEINLVLRVLRSKGPKMGPKRDFSIFMKSMHGIFLIFFHEVEAIWTLKMDQSNCFLKNFVLRFAGRKRPKRVQNEVFKFYGSKNFSFFFSVAWRIKIDWNAFLGKNLNLRFFELKNGPKMGQKWGFQVDQKLIHGIFLIFCMKLLYPKDLNLTYMTCLGENHIIL